VVDLTEHPFTENDEEDPMAVLKVAAGMTVGLAAVMGASAWMLTVVITTEHWAGA
jgi:hypothetical protein